MISAVITCAGNGNRFGKDKLFALIDKEPVFIRALRQFLAVKEIGEVILAVREANKKQFEKWLKKFKLKVNLVEGGEERYVSAYKGVVISKGEYVLIHDGARPLVTTKLIKRVIKGMKKHRAVMAAVETTTCVKVVNPESLEVEQCLERQKSWLGQTPHGFKREIILKAYEKAIKGEISGMDDCELVRKTGVRVKVIPGEWTNKKVTLPTDLNIVRQWYKLLKKEGKL